MSKVSVVVRCFNEEKHIGTLLKKIREQTIQDVEIVVVDSGSSDRTVEIANQFNVQLTTITPSEFTFGRSLNRGCAKATGEFLVFASAHVVPVKNTWLEELLKPFEDPEVALSYGSQIGHETTKFSEHQVFAKQFPKESDFKKKTPFCNNANSCVRRSLWEKNKFDESLSGLEDLGWAKWAIEQGHCLAYNAAAPVIHIHEETPQKIKNRYKREAIALKKIFSDAHLSFFEFLGALVVNVTLDWGRALVQGKLFGNIQDIVMYRTMQYWGTYKGMRVRSDLTQEMIRQYYYPRHISRFRKLFQRKKKPEKEVASV